MISNLGFLMIINKPIIEATIIALKSVRNVRYFRTERGYQGEFFCELFDR